VEIREVEWGLAYHYGDHIEVNKNLKDYPELYEFIMEHEMKHSEVKGFNTNDLLWDVEESFKWINLKKTFQVWGFMLKYPKSLTQLIPFGFKDKKLVIDFNRIVVYGLFSLFIITLFYVGRLTWHY